MVNGQNAIAQRFRLALGFLGDVAPASIPQLLQAAAARYGVDPTLVLAVARRESGLNPNAVSPAGAQGVMQLMPPTAASLGVKNPFDAAQNIDAGVRYLAQLLAKYGDTATALAAYNWGPGSVDKAKTVYGANWWNVAPTETLNYVTAILGSNPAQAAPADSGGDSFRAGTGPLTIDASTGEVIPSSVDVSTLAPADEKISTLKNPLLLTALGIGVYLLAELLTDD